MATQQGKLLILAGAGALLYMSAGKKKKKRSSSVSPKEPEQEDLDKDDGGAPVFETDSGESNAAAEDEASESLGDQRESVLSKYLGPQGRSQLGSLYQIRQGDSPLAICREALFGSRDPVTDPIMRQAAIDLLVRIDCSPWNQAIYGVELSKLSAGHAQINEYWTQRGVSFDPVYSNNLERIDSGEAPSGAEGHHFALIWIPMINLDKLDMEGIVTTEGMYHDDGFGERGGNMVNPPSEILELGFDELSFQGVVGCNLPEGDFRQKVVAY